MITQALIVCRRFHFSSYSQKGHSLAGSFMHLADFSFFCIKPPGSLLSLCSPLLSVFDSIKHVCLSTSSICPWPHRGFIIINLPKIGTETAILTTLKQKRKSWCHGDLRHTSRFIEKKTQRHVVNIANFCACCEGIYCVSVVQHAVPVSRRLLVRIPWSVIWFNCWAPERDP